MRNETFLDPVCGMEVHPDRAAGSSHFIGETFYFCSSGCKETFDRDPVGFLKPTPSRAAAPPAVAAPNEWGPQASRLRPVSRSPRVAHVAV